MRRVFGAKGPSLALLACLFCLVGFGCNSILGDFSVSGATARDSGGAPDSSSGDAPVEAIDAPSGSCQAVAQAPDVYVGQVASADGSQSTGANLSFSWSVQSAPTGSGVKTAALQGANSSAASFVPDVPGTYVLGLAVSSPTCSGSTTSVSPVARVPQVVFAQGEVGGGGASADYAVADLDGGNAHALMCPDSVATTTPNGIAALAAYAGRAYDFWEAPSGQLSRFAAFTLDVSADAYFTHLWVGTTDRNCNSPPVDLTTAGFGPGPPFGVEPHFRPDGQRFVVYDSDWNIVTYPTDGGTAGTVVASYSAGQSGSDPFDASFDPVSYPRPEEPPRVEWTPTGGVAWARAAAAGWEIVTAPDPPADAGAPPTQYMHCAGVPPRQIAMLKDGTVIAGFRPSPGAGEDIYLLKPDRSQDCVVEQRYTTSPDASISTATDFAVSPDGKWLAFLALDPTTQDASAWAMPGGGLYPGGYVYVVSISAQEGGAPVPQQVSSEPAMYGPRWIGGGTRVVFTRLDDPTTSDAPATSVVVITPDGGGELVVASGDGKRTFVSTSGSGACSVGGGAAAAATSLRGAEAAGLLAVAAIARAARRRRQVLRRPEARSAEGAEPHEEP